MNVKIERDYIKQSYKVFIFEESRVGRHFYKANDTIITVEDGSMIEDEQVLFCRIPDKALDAFANALSELGIKTENDHKIAGVLEATKYHLEDMRKIAKVIS